MRPSQRGDALAPSPASGHCRNCGAPAPGIYCPECGQETRIALPTLREFMREAAGRLVAFDGRLWRTLFALAFRPGTLTLAYLAGRRRHYVRPARLFLAMSLVMFALIRFELGGVQVPDSIVIHDPGDRKVQAPPAPKDATPGEDFRRGFREGFGDAPSLRIDEDLNVDVKGMGNTLVGAELRERLQRFNKLTQKEKAEQLVDGALRYGSYAVFLLLPVFAGLQYLSYLGRMRRYPGRPRLYAEHLVYAAHLHTFWFFIAIAVLVVPWPPARLLLAAWAVFHAARGKRVVYGGSLPGRLVRSLFVFVAYFVAVSFAVVGLLFASVLLR
jgi:hypothetical protein